MFAVVVTVALHLLRDAARLSPLELRDLSLQLEVAGSSEFVVHLKLADISAKLEEGRAKGEFLAASAFAQNYPLKGSINIQNRLWTRLRIRTRVRR